MRANIYSTPPQAQFHALKCRYPLFVGGYGSGKTQGMIDSAFMDASHAKDALIAIYEPTFDLIDLTVAPRLLEKLDEHKILHRHNKSKHKITTHGKNGFGNFIMRSLANPETIISYESYRAHIDELDTIPYVKANELWDKIIGRNRQVPTGFTRHNVNNRVSVYTTPEGFNFVQKRWVELEDEQNEYDLVRASSLTNPFLPASYIKALKNTYTSELQLAYINGEFVNLTSGTVYKCYNRQAHNSVEEIKPAEPLFIGCDFNVTRQAATVYVKRDAGKQWHAVAELVDMYDTPEMVRIINERWKEKGHQITIYPDASGGNRHSTNASTSDIAMLTQARYEVRKKDANPAVKDRVNATNVAFSKGILFVNAKNCPTVASCFEKQAYDKNGEPDKKSGNDHQNDASTYPIAYEFPIMKPATRLNVL